MGLETIEYPKEYPVTLSAYTNEDSEGNAMLKNHAYLATIAGEVCAIVAASGIDKWLYGYVGTTDDPAGAGIVVQVDFVSANGDWAGVSFLVAEGEYFEVRTDSTNAVTILWKSFGILSKPVDQD